jgi:hypothetical protein
LGVPTPWFWRGNCNQDKLYIYTTIYNPKLNHQPKKVMVETGKSSQQGRFISKRRRSRMATSPHVTLVIGLD